MVITVTTTLTIPVIFLCILLTELVTVGGARCVATTLTLVIIVSVTVALPGVALAIARTLTHAAIALEARVRNVIEPQIDVTRPPKLGGDSAISYRLNVHFEALRVLVEGEPDFDILNLVAPHVIQPKVGQAHDHFIVVNPLTGHLCTRLSCFLKDWH
jgi:hypothetical protein